MNKQEKQEWQKKKQENTQRTSRHYEDYKEMYESEERMQGISEEKRRTPWRDREKRKTLTKMTKEEKRT